MSIFKAQQVFIPGGYPTYTYVERSDKSYEEDLRDAILTPGQIISMAGPSKSGKTVLVEKVVGNDNLISVTGAGITDPEQLWERILNWMDSPHEVRTESKDEKSGKVAGEIKGELGPPGAKITLTARTEGQSGRGSSKGAVTRRRGLSQIVTETANSEFVILIDDFHYMSRDAQVETAKQVKEAARQGVKFIIASVLHRSDDIVRALPELRGRVTSLDFDYWNQADLKKIAITGFNLLNFEVDADSVAKFAIESAGSPQIMQSICLSACLLANIRETSAIRQIVGYSGVEKKRIFERVAAIADFRSLVDVLDSGPKVRGVERKIYNFTDGTIGDVYRCVLKSIALDPPSLSFPYSDIVDRVEKTCIIEKPVGSSVFGSCSHMAKLALDNFPNERAIDWDDQKQVLDIPDPYLMFYLRWSERLLEPN
jgi:hypothetical protein